MRLAISPQYRFSGSPLKLLLGLILAMTLTACGLADKTNPTANDEAANQAIALRLINAIGTADYGAVSKDVHASGHVNLRSEFEHLVYNAQTPELDALMDPLHIAINDRNSDVKIVIAEDDMVVLQYQITGTHTGNFYGIAPTSLTFTIPSAAVLKFANGRVIESWFMADEVGLLRQIGQPMPARADGKFILPPVRGETAIAANDLIISMQANPQPGQEFQNKLMVVTRRMTPRPARAFGEITRRGHYHIIDAGELHGDPAFEFAGAFSDRADKIEHLVSNEDWVAVKFRLTAQSTGNMFGLPPTQKPMDNWEISFANFDGETWKTAWFFGDDMGMLNQLGGTQDYFVPVPGVVQPSAATQ